ncbi:hypothetical protein X975_18115, partial [Stegodyphus mimosarum]
MFTKVLMRILTRIFSVFSAFDSSKCLAYISFLASYILSFQKYTFRQEFQMIISSSSKSSNDLVAYSLSSVSYSVLSRLAFNVSSVTEG